MFRNLLNPENGLMIVLTQITDTIFLSFFWLMSCMLVVTVGPGTAALYDAAFHCFRTGEEHPWSRFARSFRRNLRVGIPAALVVLAVEFAGYCGIIWLWNGAAAGKISWVLFSAAAFVAFVLVGVLALVFPLLSRFETSTGQLLSNSFRLGMANLPRTLGLSALHTLTFVLCIRYVIPLFFLPSMCMFFSSFLIEPILKPYMPEEPKSESTE